jgi:uncharacterized protein YegP (UPF0339 family)
MKPKFETREARDDQYYNVLKAGNGEIVNASETFPTERIARKNKLAVVRAVLGFLKQLYGDVTLSEALKRFSKER